MKPSFHKKTFFVIAFLIFSSVAFAQNGNEIYKSQILIDWERAKAYTKEYLEAMPADAIGFKPTPEIRSFAEQMLHLAQGNIGLAGNATGVKSPYAGKNIEKDEAFKGSKETLSKVVLESYDLVIAGIKAMDAGTFNETIKMANFTVSRYGWLSKAFEHQTHHRGQSTIYLRLKGITPPAEKLF